MRAGSRFVRRRRPGEILFEDAAGDVQLVIPRPAMWDSAGTLGDRANEQGDVDADVERDGG